MKIFSKFLLGTVALASVSTSPAVAAIEGSLDPPSVVAQWSNASTKPRIININFTESRWPATWQGETGRDCPDFSNGGYVNAIIDVPAKGDNGDVTYPVSFHNCTFATRDCYNGYAAATAAFSRQYYLGEKPSGNSAQYLNNWTVAGHTTYLEDNIKFDAAGKPVYGEAGFVQMCRDAATTAADGSQVSMHGWMEIDHIPYVERIQWSWSSTSWGRGIKCDIKIGDGEWKPLVWMGSERQKQGWTSFSDQGYLMENVIDAHDVSLRWRVWDGEDFDNPVQKAADGTCPFTQAIDPMAQRQAPRVHKIQIFGDPVTAEQAEFARKNPLADVGELSDLGNFGGGSTAEPAPDDRAPIVLLTVNQDGTADYTTVQAAIDAVPSGYRGIIRLAPGIYQENVYAGRKDDHDKFISLIGEDPSTTILTSDVHRQSSGDIKYYDCAALNVYVPRFYAEGLTIRNTSGNVGQAEALFTAGDAHMFKNCVISGYQDTYKANVGARGYFVDCVIEGATDFIYDGGLEWFENCELRCVKGGGYVTAPAETMMPMTKVMYPELSADRFYPGLFFSKCRVTAADGVADGAYYLGRPWKEQCGAAFLNCTLGSHVNAAGWKEWGGTENVASLYEYRSKRPDGSLADVSGRASFSRQATDAEVDAYFNPEFLFAKASSVPFDYSAILNSATVPGNFTFSARKITWESDDNAAGYIIYKDGQFLKFVDKPETQRINGSVITVQTVSRYGVTSPIVEAKPTVKMLAFPTAEGFGKYATGGRGGKVVKVTSLADDGSEGTLRWAFDQHKGEPITIVFEVSGDITLASELRVNRSNWTLAGQTAPGDGVVITHAKVNFGGSQNFIVRNVRFRIGQKTVAGDIQADNACGAENCSNFIFDHCSFGWSVEENMNTADCHFLTVQYCMVHEGLYNAGHHKGVRGYGCQWGGSPATYHHNLLAHNQSRSCRFNGARGQDYVVFMEYINNVNYNYGKQGGCYGGENTADIASFNGLNSAHDCNFINNYYKPGAASNASSVTFFTSSYARDGAKSWGPSKWFVNGNVAEGFAAATADNWTAVTVEGYKKDQVKSAERIVTATPYWKYSLAGVVGKYTPEEYMLEGYESAADAFNSVVAKAGTINRDKVETRVAADARDGVTTWAGAALGKGIIDTERDAEGFFAYNSNYTVPVDSDGDGMPDEWERSMGLDPSTPDNNALNCDGYTALELYLNSLMGEKVEKVEFAGIEQVIVPAASMSYDALSSTLSLDSSAIGGTIEVYGTNGAMLTAGRIASTRVSLASLPAGLLLVKVQAPGAAPSVLKIMR